MNSGQQVKKCKWKAVFKLEPKRILVLKVKDFPEVKLVTDSDGRNTSITSIEVITPELSFVEAINHSKLKANRCIDMISFISGFGVSCTLKQINELGTSGTPKTGATFCSADAVISKPQEVNITTTAFSNVLQGMNEKLARQLSHYRRGLSSIDIVEQIREFYQVVEDEYPNNHPFRKKYKNVRHLVSHAELADPRSKSEAMKILGKTYFDPSAPTDMTTLVTHLKQIKDEAERIIKSKI